MQTTSSTRESTEIYRSESNTAFLSEEIAERSLNQLLADPKIGRMIEEEEFIRLVDEFGGSLFNYIHLAHVV